MTTPLIPLMWAWVSLECMCVCVCVCVCEYTCELECVWGGGLCLSMYVGVSLNFAYVWGGG